MKKENNLDNKVIKKETIKIYDMTFAERIYLILDALPSANNKLEFYDKEFIVQAIIDLIEKEGWKHG